MEAVDPAVDCQFLPTCPRILGNRRAADVVHLLDNVQFAKPIERLGLRKIAEGFAVLLVNIPHVSQPVVAQPKTLPPKGCPHPAATIMSADNDVAHLQDIDRELHHRQAIQVRVHNQVGDIPLNKQFAGRETDNLVRRDPAVRATNPEIFRRLLLGKLKEKFRLYLPNSLGPGPVVFEEMIERFHGEERRKLAMKRRLAKLSRSRKPPRPEFRKRAPPAR